jgi:prefoldin subunit 5
MFKPKEGWKIAYESEKAKAKASLDKTFDELYSAIMKQKSELERYKVYSEELEAENLMLYQQLKRSKNQ